MNCPQCHSENIEQSVKFDLTLIDREECQHDFECNDCGCLFNIVYAPIATKIVQKGEVAHAA
jgi:hypothetical protein